MENSIEDPNKTYIITLVTVPEKNMLIKLGASLYELTSHLLNGNNAILIERPTKMNNVPSFMMLLSYSGTILSAMSDILSVPVIEYKSPIPNK
jgi:hypothetical protein